MRQSTRYALAMRRLTRSRNARTFREQLHEQRCRLAATIKTVLSMRRPGTAHGTGVADDALQLQVLRVVEGHPEGITAQDVGNELGVDWRRLIGSMQVLGELGAIEQIEQELYPVTKRSRRC